MNGIWNRALSAQEVLAQFRPQLSSLGDPDLVGYFTFDEAPDSQQILGFYMGKNTPERKDYIMANLIVPVEE